VRIGLSFSQARIYLSLISLGAADAKRIAQTAGIDRGEAYRQLESLQKRGLVEKILKIPNDYKPMALNEAIGTLIQQKNREKTETQQRVKALLKKDIYYNTSIEESKFSIIPEEDYLRHYIIKANERAQNEWLWFTQIERIPIAITNYYASYKKALDRGVRWRTIAELNKPTDDVLEFIRKYTEQNPNFTIRFVDPSLLVTFAIRDNKELDFFTERAKGLADSRALYSNNPCLISLIKDYFEIRWNTAMTKYPKKRALVEFTAQRDAT